MRATFWKYHLIFLSFILFSCSNGNYTNVSLEGYVKDNDTKEVIPHSKVQVICWVYDTELWESKEVKKEVLSNEKGFYLINFDKGEAMDILVSSSSYDNKKISITLKKSKNEMNFLLNKKK